MMSSDDSIKIKHMISQRFVKQIIKRGAEKDSSKQSKESVHLTALATELFLAKFIRATLKNSASEGRKTITYDDIASVLRDKSVSGMDLEFMEDILPWLK